MIGEVFGKATNPVATHFHLATVGIVNAHPEVGDPGGMNRQKLVRANAKPPVTESPGELLEPSGLP